MSANWVYLTENKFGVSSQCNVNFLFNENNIYISDNHLCALWGWIKKCSPNDEHCFIHVDYHDDLCAPNTYDCIKTISQAKTFHDFLQSCGQQEQLGKSLAWDTYIQIAYKMFPKWFSNTLFLTTTCSPFMGFSECRKQSSGVLCVDVTKDIFHRSSLDYCSCNLEETFQNVIIGKRGKKVILNIDLDYFFDCDDTHERDPFWSDDKIDTIVTLLKNALASGHVQVLTIALSPECCGGWKNSYEVMKIFLPILSQQVRAEFSSILVDKI